MTHNMMIFAIILFGVPFIVVNIIIALCPKDKQIEEESND